MKPLRKTLELLLSQEAPQPGAVLPARSSHMSPGGTLGGGTLALESASQARYSAMRRAKSSSLLQAFPVAGRPRASEGVEPGLARSIRRAPGETDQLLCRVPSAELLRSARTSRDTRVGAYSKTLNPKNPKAGCKHTPAELWLRQRSSCPCLVVDMHEHLCTVHSIRLPCPYDRYLCWLGIYIAQYAIWHACEEKPSSSVTGVIW